MLGPVVLRCVIVDDSADFLGVARTLLEQEGIEVVGTARNCGEALERTAELRPDVTLVDVYLGDESGLSAVRRLAGRGDAGGLILISTHSQDELAELVDASPAIGFVAKAMLSGDAIRRLLGAADS